MAEEWIIDESELQYLEKLGAGVCGEVYHVTLQTEDGRTIDAAAKIFRENQESDIESQKKELNFLRQLKHPNIVEFFCAVLFPITIIVTEFAAKGSLYEYLKRQIRLPVHHMLEWARQASSAVQYLQKENVVHRDIKSSNFVITANDSLKLCDFGIAKRQYKTEKTNHESGTIPWMAPEAIEKLTSKASDIYSLGIVIWELISCEIPYQGKESLAILYAVKVYKLRPDIPPHCPPALKDLLERCWKDNRKKRPDIDEVLRTIEALIQKQQEHDNARFYKKHGKREIYHLYHQHLANENEQNALTDHVIPMDNGMTGSSFVDGFETDKSFNHFDINGNVSSAERGMKGRHIRFIFAFIFIALVVVGLVAVLVTLLKGNISCSNHVLPRIDKAIFNDCKDLNGGRYWSCEVSCENGFEWKDTSKVIQCDRRSGSWNITISNNLCEKTALETSTEISNVANNTFYSDISIGISTSSPSASTINQRPIPTPLAANRSDDISCTNHVLPRIDKAIFKCKDLNGGRYWSCEVSCENGFEWNGTSKVIQCDRRSGSWNITISNNLCEKIGLETSTEVSTISNSTFPSDIPKRLPSAYMINQGPTIDTDPQAPTKLPQKDSATTLVMPLSESVNHNKTGAIYRLVICNISNPDESYNATIYREGNYTKSIGSVEICVSRNCTNVYFSSGTSEVRLKFSISSDSNDVSINPTHNPSIMLANPRNGEIENNNSSTLPIPGNVMVSVVMDEG